MNGDIVSNEKIEELIINTARNLPHIQALQLLEFARFLEAQHLNEELLAGEDQSEIDIDNEKWDSLFSSEKSPILLKKLADEALNEYRTGNTKTMTFDDEGSIIPE